MNCDRSRFASWILLCMCAGLCPPAHSGAALQVGYAVLTPDAGSATPVAAALLRYTNPEGVLVSQTSFAAVLPRTSGRIFIDEVEGSTGVSLVNHGTGAASVSLVLRDAAGREIARTTERLSPRQHVSRFARAWFPGAAEGLTGSLGFESDQEIAAIALRESRNGFGEPVYAARPVVDSTAAATSDPIVLPQIAASRDYQSQVVLVNPTPRTIRGRVSLFRANGDPLPVEVDGRTASKVAFQIEAHGTYRAELLRADSDESGYAVVDPDPGDVAPAGFALLQYRPNGTIVSDAALESASATASARVFLDNVEGYTGIALVNRENQEATATFSLTDTRGVAIGTAVQRTVPARGHRAIFAHELFPGVRKSFAGVIEISSSSPIHPLCLKISVNSRDEQILTMLPVADLLQRRPEAVRVFPQIAIGEGFSTQILLIEPPTTSSSTGSLAFHQSDGGALIVPSGGETGSDFRFRLPRGGARRYLPGNTTALATITLLDPSTQQPTSEIVVHEGGTARPRLQVLDADSMPRDDFELSYSSIQPKIATVDPGGTIGGIATGFSTFTVSGGGAVLTATITVVRIRSGQAGNEISGIARDTAGRLYLASARDHTIARSQSLERAPEVYAGAPKSPGLANDSRLRSLFKNPVALALDQASGDLYVSDAANHVIRRIRAGREDRVETLAGTGAAGHRDGTLAEASFDDPQGIALDHRGNLWVVDSGNHTIRKIDLRRETVTTIAGAAASPGWTDGGGSDARFNAPVGIALEVETVAELLERQARRGAPPPVRLIVADTGNAVLRRVRENGMVETVRGAAALDSPRWVALDPLGNIYVTETRSGRARVMLAGGEVVTATQPNTLSSPAAVIGAELGSVIFADGRNSAQMLTYGPPEIESLSRIRMRDGDRVTLHGSNFAPESIVLVGSKPVSNLRVENTQSITFTTPVLPIGPQDVKVHNRGGLAEQSLVVPHAPLAALAPGTITTVAGAPPSLGDGSPATEATLSSPFDMAVDSAGNVFVADTFNNRIRRVDPVTGIITTVAGDGGSIDSLGSGDGGPAVAATVSVPHEIVVDAAGNLFILDTDDQRVRKIDSVTGIITTFAGIQEDGFSGDGGPANAARLRDPYGIALDRDGNLYIADTFNHRIRRVDRTTGIITTFAGTGEKGFSGDLGPASEAKLSHPYGVTVDAARNVLIADSSNNRIRMVEAKTGTIRTVAGNGLEGFDGEGGLATQAALTDPRDVAVDTDGNFYVTATFDNVIRRVDARTGAIVTIAGAGQGGLKGSGIPAISAHLENPHGITLDAAGNLYIANADDHEIRLVSPTTGLIRTIAGFDSSSDGLGGPAADFQLAAPFGVAVDARGNVFIADSLNDRIQKVDATTGFITAVAGTGSDDFNGDDLPPTATALRFPEGIAVHPKGNLFIADTDNNRIRMVDPVIGILFTVAGNQRDGDTGDGGPATSAELSHPNGIAVDAKGNLYIADTGNHRVRKVDAATGIITTLAGNDSLGFSGDGGPAASASLAFPHGVALDSQANVFIADSGNDRIRKIDAQTGIITTVAGGDSSGFRGDDGPATAAGLSSPAGIAVDSAGNLYIADFDNNRVRRVDATTGIITTIAGSGETGRDNGDFSGDDGPAVAARLAGPIAVAVDEEGNVYIADFYNDRIRAVRRLEP